MIVDDRIPEKESGNFIIEKPGNLKNRFRVEKKEDSTKSEDSIMLGKKSERHGMRKLI
jgi:hypothetical protein